jgi:hypothetical protein
MMRYLKALLSLVFLLSFLGCDKSTPSVDSADRAAQKEEKQKQETSPAEAPSESEDDEPETAEHAPAVERSLLWRVEGPNGPVYLFGTVHGGIDGTWDEFPGDARTALEESEVVVLEADLENAGAAAIQARDKMMYPANQSLKDELGEEAFSRLVEELGTPGTVLERLRPWAAYAELTRKWLPAGTAVDQLVQAHGKKLDKDFRYIETIPQQIDILARAVSVDVLRDTLQRTDEMKQEQSALIDAYKAGDAARIEEVAFDAEEIERFPTLYETLFDERNEAWMKDLEQYLKRGDVFVAVGVGHLVGEDGLVARLEARGYEVERTAAD